MAALTADSTADLRHRGDPKIRHLTNGVASETYYKGATVYYLAAGKITPVMAAGLKPAGIVVEASDGAIGTSDKVKVATGGEWLIPYASAALTDEGELIHADASAASDNPADLIAGGLAAGDMAFGRVKEFVSSTLGSWVDIEDRAVIVAS